MNTAELRLTAYCKALKLPTVARTYKAMARDAETQGTGHVEFLAALLEQEVLQRDENGIHSRIRAARFPYPKTLDSFDFSAVPELNKHKVLALSKGEFIQHRENLLLIGNPGTGKTHLAIALGMAACRVGYRVRFYTAAALVNELLAAQREHQLHKLEKQWLQPHLVVVDELGYIPFSQTGSQLLFTFLSARYERGSVAITSNLEFTRWTEIFGDDKLTAALLDRLTHRSHILTMNGESYRFRESLRRQHEEP